LKYDIYSLVKQSYHFYIIFQTKTIRKTVFWAMPTNIMIIY